MRLEFPPLSPGICRIVVIDVAEQDARLCPVHDETDVVVHPHGAEALVARPIELVEPQAGTCGVHLQVEGGGLDGLLLRAGQAREARGEGAGDAEVHQCLPYAGYV
ncbi:MAG TPA: hypothetical protein VEA99_13635 [Gemmatimonadaceae bacterium]|nr:hypothetical protein [Gemmatimonadaceae bacterium]